MCFEFLKKSVFDPEINVASPETLLLSWWYLSNSALIHLANTIHIACALLEFSIVEPGVIVFEVRLQVLSSQNNMHDGLVRRLHFRFRMANKIKLGC